MGCPASQFYEYEKVEGKMTDGKKSTTRAELLDETDFNIKVGYYFQYIDEKENGLITIVETYPSFDGNAEGLIKEVKSSTFGKLKKTKDIYKLTGNVELKNKLIYKLTFDHHNEKKTLKKLRNDTISIEFTHGKKSMFVSTVD